MTNAMSKPVEKWVCGWDGPVRQIDLQKVLVHETKNQFDVVGETLYLLEMRRRISKREGWLHDTAVEAVEAYVGRLDAEIEHLKSQLAQLEHRKGEALRLWRKEERQL